MTQDKSNEANEAVVGFGAAEVAYLLSRYADDQVSTSIDVMGLNPDPGEEFLAAGASSLLARGMVSVVDDELELVGVAALTAYVLAAAEHWTEVGFMLDQDNAVDGALIVQAPEAAVMLSPRALGTWYVTVKNPALTASESVLLLAVAFLGEQPGGAVFLSARTKEWRTTLFLRRMGEGAWELARGEAPFWSAAAVETASEAEAKSALQAMLEMPTAPVSSR